MKSELLRDSAEIDEEKVEATVLVVDDESNIVTLLQTWLETIGCRVESANDGESGIARARELRPDLILMDGMMPKMSGFDACRVLKEEEATRDIPVIFLTVQGEVRDVVKGLELGAHGYMTKPFKPQELLARVRSTLKIKQIQDRLKVHTQRLRQQWNWMHGVVESLPLGLLVFDPETQRVIYLNDRLTDWLSLSDWESERRDLSKELIFRGQDSQPVDLLRGSEDIQGEYRLDLAGREPVRCRLWATSFEKNGRRGRQVLFEPL